jgi:radical SAM superfamily enzyme YgiQ (UPF0313 family)
MPNALLVYPEFPPSYWGYKYALDFVGKRSAMPPLGLLTVAAMFPKEYHLRVVDMNVRPLTDADLNWADIVFTSTMIVQRNSLQDVIERCNRARIPIVAGGPHPTSFHEEINKPFAGGEGVDYFILDEVEDIFPQFLQDLRNGAAKKIYRATKKPDVTRTPIPRYDLINLHDYGSMALQFSRGCPFDCEFCDITKLFGRVPRTKTPEQMIAEFEALYRLGWQGALFVVDDNFIGNKRDAMRLLPQVARWQEGRNFPFSLYTEASVNLVEIPEMLEAMSNAGFNMVFLGIESPNEEALLTTKKKQNTSKEEAAGSYLLNAIRKIQAAGLEATGGFIIGLDGDKEFDSHIRFIQEAGIPVAMAGLLTALKGTNLYHRLEREGRLLDESTGNNTDITLNFIPELPREQLIAEYKRVVSTLYDPGLKNYLERCLTLLKHLTPKPHTSRRVGKTEFMAFVKSVQRQLFSKQGPAYLKYLLKVIADYPRMFPEAIRLAIMGYHFEKMTSQQIAVDDFKRLLETQVEAFKAKVAEFTKAQENKIGEIAAFARKLLAHAQARYEEIHEDFRCHVQEALNNFQRFVLQQYLDVEFRTFKEKISRFARAQGGRVGEIAGHAQEVFGRVRAQYEEIHEDFRDSVQDMLEVFQQSVFKQYLEAELGAFKATASRFARTQGDRIGEAAAHVQELFARVQGQYKRIHKDFRHSVQDTVISFQESVKAHLHQLVGPVTIQAKILDESSGKLR